MKPGRTRPRVVAVFAHRWPGGLLPVKMVVQEVNRADPPVSRRAVEYALSRAVDRGLLKIIKGADGGALYGLASCELNPAALDCIRSDPLRTLQRLGGDGDTKGDAR